MEQQIAAIEGNCKAPQTKQRYNSTNHEFIYWLYHLREDYPDMLKEELVEELEAIDATSNSEKIKKRERGGRSLRVG